MLNTALYAGGGALLSAVVSALTGYALAKYRFSGRVALFTLLLAGVLVPPVVLAVPQYLLVAKVGLTNTYWRCCCLGSIALRHLPGPDLRGRRTRRGDRGGPDGRLPGIQAFLRIGVPMMVPGLVTIFLFQFVAIWNNFLLPCIMLGNENKFPLTVGCTRCSAAGRTSPALYSLVVIGSLLSIIPLMVLFLAWQRYWRTDIASGAVKQ